ncbi:hypothetical protein HYW82_00355, partial [Candidatus Peregrinibacteria bacterium]|nr:hypothetical protein [Candidatus Peregrinibacteria bacterium]
MTIIEQKIDSVGARGYIIKACVFAMISIALVLANFFVENGIGGMEPNAVDNLLIENETEVLFPDNGVVRLEKGEGFVKTYDSGISYAFEFSGPRLWGNFFSSKENLMIVVDDVVIVPMGGVFDLKFDGQYLDMSAYNGDVKIEFLPKKVEMGEIGYGYVDAVNRLLVPRGRKVTIPMKKVNGDIGALLPSKLMKEFKYAIISDEDRRDKWVMDNLAADDAAAVANGQKFSELIVSGPVDTADGIVSELGNYLILFPEKKFKDQFENVFSVLDSAVYYASRGDAAKVTEALSKFMDNSFLISADLEYSKKTDEYIYRILPVAGGDLYSEILNSLLDKRFDGQQYETLRLFWREVYRAIDGGEISPEKALDLYYTYLNRMDSGDRVFLTFQNQLFDNLFLHYPMFYRDAYFSMKGTLEEKLLKAYANDPLKNEIIQSLVSSKIDFLKRLRKFFFDGNIEIVMAKEIFSRLVHEVNDLLQDKTGVAVLKLFESELADVGDFWGYLSSPEYQTKVYGATHRDRYEAYLKERKKIAGFTDIREDILGEQEGQRDVADIVAEIEEVFAAQPEIRDLEIGEIGNEDQRFVEVSGVVGGYSFRAQYDRSLEALKDIYVFDELVSENAVKLDKILVVLMGKFAELAEDGVEPEEEITLESSAHRMARVFVAKKVVEFGFLAE